MVAGMARRPTSPPQIEVKVFTSDGEVTAAISKLRRRRAQVEAIRDATYDDPRRETTESAVQTAILEIFGPNSPEYRDHQYLRIWRGVEFVGMHQGDLDAGFKEGVPQTLAVLDELLNRLEEKRLDLPKQGSDARPTPSLSSGRRVFIGHGHSLLWSTLKDFLVDRLRLPFEEFNREPTAGLSTKERLEQMLNDTGFALLVHTAEDEHSDGTQHARENVVHETGLFQGRHGFRRAIVLLEEGCAEFSNMRGITQIRFPRGDLMARSEEIRRVLEREGFVNAARLSP